MGSPRKNGDTATLLKSSLTELEIKGAEVKTIFLYNKKIAPCLECFQCQDKLGEYKKPEISRLCETMVGLPPGTQSQSMGNLKK